MASNLLVDFIKNRLGTGGVGVYLGGVAAANLLDDKDEGTFAIPEITGESTSFVKIGKVVNFTISGGGTLSSGTLTGLPYAAAIDSAASIYVDDYAPGAGEVLQCVIAGTSVHLRTYNQATGNYTVLSDLTGTSIIITGSYIV
ncbi:hypothetical protein KAR91_84590 [Candidatus Pacearchaeota archaeon]|nr:hypothetical protein [Candidatus Pacearchaeota archaeon]